MNPHPAPRLLICIIRLFRLISNGSSGSDILPLVCGSASILGFKSSWSHTQGCGELGASRTTTAQKTGARLEAIQGVQADKMTGRVLPGTSRLSYSLSRMPSSPSPQLCPDLQPSLHHLYTSPTLHAQKTCILILAPSSRFDCLQIPFHVFSIRSIFSQQP